MKTEDLSKAWFELVEKPSREIGRPAPRLVVMPSAYREFYSPVLECIRKLGDEYPDRRVAVMVPETVERRWYNFLFRHRTTLLKGLLLLRGGPRVVVITTPWYPWDALRSQDHLGSRKIIESSKVQSRLQQKPHAS